LLGQITQALEKINKNDKDIPSTSKINTIEEHNASESESTEDSADDSASDNSLVQQINQIEDNIQGTDTHLEIDRIHRQYKQNNNSYNNYWRNGKTKNYYPRPTPPDIQYEERAIFKSSYDGTSVYEWNIDGKSEYEILNTL